MADIASHRAQAEHNREVARFLLTPPRHDWAITAAFYSAVHFFEAWLFNEPEKHTETSIPTESSGKQKYTAHAWREAMVQQKLSKEAFKNFRKLRDNSETARYLSLYRLGSGAGAGWTSAPAPTFFRPEQSRVLVETALDNLRDELDFRTFLDTLGLEKKSPIMGRLVKGKALKEVSSREELLRCSVADLRRVFGPSEIELLKTALADKGLSLSES